MAQFQLPAAIITRAIRSRGTTILFPQVTALPNPGVEYAINAVIYETVIALQQEQLKGQTGINMEMVGHYEIKTNERGILSLTLSNYAYSYPMAHGMTLLKSLTFDTVTGRLYRLSDLFKPGSNYTSVLSEKVLQQIRERQIPLLGEFPDVAPDQDYYVADKSLVLYYQLYAITPYAYGFPMFPISIYELLDLAPENGILSTLSVAIA